MTINIVKLKKELDNAGVQFSALNAEGQVFDTDGVTEIQTRPDVLAVIQSHDPTPVIEIYVEFNKPISAPDFLVSTPKISNDPELALDEAIREMEKGDSPKSIALIALSTLRALEAMREEIKALRKEIDQLKKVK